MNKRPTGRTEAQLKMLVEKFETATLHKRVWSHSAHLTVGAYYVLNYGRDEALIRLRAGIRRLNMSHGVVNSAVAGYHETLTRFWVIIIEQFLSEYRSANPGIESTAAITTLAKRFQNRRKLYQDYWSFDIIACVQARRVWVPPDARALASPMVHCPRQSMVLGGRRSMQHG